MNISFGQRSLWILVIVVTATAAQAQQSERLSVNDGRPVASAIRLLETRFNTVITYEDLPLVHADDIVDVTESVRRDLHLYAPGKAPKVRVPRGGELNFEFNPNDPVEVVLAQLLSESELVMPSSTFRIQQGNGVMHVIPQSLKGLTGKTVPVRSILDVPVDIPPQERTGIELLEAWCDAVNASSKERIVIGSAPLNRMMSYKDDKGLSSPNARDALTDILLRSGKGPKLSWQLLYSPSQQFYVINIHLIK
jgi:hypothetical protein